MGLKFYRNPEDIDAENAAAAKLDRATAQRRSAIRREPTIRPRREQSSPSYSMTDIMRHRQDIRQMHMQLNAENIRTDREINVLESQLQLLRRQRERAIDRLETFRVRTVADGARLLSESTPAPRIITTPADPTLTLQQDGHSDPEPSSQILLPRPARESNLRFEVAATGSTSPGPDTNAIPSPPRSVSDTGRSRPVDGPLDTWDTVPNLSHDFAPARRALDAIDQADATIAAARETMRDTMEREEAGLETPPPETWENSYPPLRRVAHMSPRPLPRSPVDGLGDRHRSPSPSSPHEESTWNNLLSTVDNDNEASSTSTSFASMTNFMPVSGSSSHRSSNTQNTSASFGEIATSSEETCDLPPGITEEDVRMIRERHRRTARRVPRRRIRTPSESQDFGVDASLYSLLRPGSFASSESEMSRLLMDHVAQRLQHRDETDSETLPPLHVFHDILDRMQRREHIPDDVWAVAGLSPDFFSRS